MTFNWRRIALAGALGGGVNATLCLLSLPVPIRDPAVHLRWHVVPAGCAHGALLALVATAAFTFAEHLGTAAQWLGAVIVSWLGGYLAWIPLDLSVSSRSGAQSLVWPAAAESDVGPILWIPIAYFGIVAGLLYASLVLVQKADGRRAILLPAAIVAGTAGSLWWWIEWGPWYFSVLHGSIWGFLVGRALSRQSVDRQGVRRAVA